jgi:hypothetical protein
VQFPRDPAPFVLLGLKKLGGERPQLFLCTVELLFFLDDTAAQLVSRGFRDLDDLLLLNGRDQES